MLTDLASETLRQWHESKGPESSLYRADRCVILYACAQEPFLILEIAGRPASYSSAAQGPWQAAVRTEIARNHAAPRDTRFGIRVEFRTPVPANANEVWDIDNLVKPTLDAMEGVLGVRAWHGPAQAADDRVDYLEASKRTIQHGESPGAHIEVYDLGGAVIG